MIRTYHYLNYFNHIAFIHLKHGRKKEKHELRYATMYNENLFHEVTHPKDKQKG
jgi:hypothetical protein